MSLRSASATTTIAVFLLATTLVAGDSSNNSDKPNSQEATLKNLSKRYVNDCLSDMSEDAPDGRQFNRKGTNKYVPYGGQEDEEDEQCDDNEQDEDRDKHGAGGRRHFNNKRNTPQQQQHQYGFRGNNNANRGGRGGGRGNNCQDNEDSDGEEDDRYGGAGGGRNNYGNRRNNNNRNSGRNYPSSRPQYPQYGQGQGQEDWLYRSRRASPFKSVPSDARGQQAGSHGDDEAAGNKCVSQCVFGYLHVLDNNRVPSEPAMIKYLQENLGEERERIRTLREMRRCFSRTASKDNEDGCAFSKSLANCLRLEIDN